MPVISVINRKGGSGKSTLSTHLAAWLARQGVKVMLGDVDRQQSTRSWLKQRPPGMPDILPWAIDQKNVLKVPVGVSHVVLDTPGGFHGLELSKVIMSSNAVLMPVCSSLFDRESAGACLNELMAMPRIASGQCKLGIVGMRIDARTHAEQTLRDWAEQLKVPFLGVLRQTQLYVKSLETGQTIFDLPPSVNQGDVAQWAAILDWLRPILQPAPAVTASKPSAAAAAAEPILHTPLPASLMPSQESFLTGDRLSSMTGQRIAVSGEAGQPSPLVLGRRLIGVPPGLAIR